MKVFGLEGREGMQEHRDITRGYESTVPTAWRGLLGSASSLQECTGAECVKSNYPDASPLDCGFIVWPSGYSPVNKKRVAETGRPGPT